MQQPGSRQVASSSLFAPAVQAEGGGMRGGTVSGKAAAKQEEFYESPPEVPSQRGVFIAVGAVGAACLMFGLGMIFRGGGEPAAASAAPTETAPLAEAMTEQQKMMREAMQMAREAQAMQKERMEMMRKEMERSEEMAAGLEPK